MTSLPWWLQLAIVIPLSLFAVTVVAMVWPDIWLLRKSRDGDHQPLSHSKENPGDHS